MYKQALRVTGLSTRSWQHDYVCEVSYVIYVFVCCIHPRRVTAAAPPSGSGHHLALQMDVARRDAVEAAIAAARKKFGDVPSLLVNSAGVAFRSLFEDVKEDELSLTLDVNLKVRYTVLYR